MKQVMRMISIALVCVLMGSVLLCGCSKQGDTISSTRYANYDLNQYVKLGQYKGIEIEKYPHEITEETMQQQIQLALTQYATQKEKDDAVQLGDQVQIDFTGYMNGELFDGGSSKGYPLAVGSGTFISGFEEGLVGAKAGDTVTLDLHFPDPYTVNPDYAGKPVRFEVKILKVYTQILPEYTDAFVKQYFGYNTIAEFEAELRKSLEDQNEYYKGYYHLSQAWDKLLTSSEVFAYPEAEYKEIYDQYVDTYEQAAANASMTLSEFLELSEEMTESEFYASIDEKVKQAMKDELILYCLAANENISITREEYDAAVASYMVDMGYATEQEFFAKYTQDEVVQSVLFDKLFDYILDNVSYNPAAE